MGYCLGWRLVGRANQLLDSGTLDGDFADRPSALEARMIGFSSRFHCEAATRLRTTGGRGDPRMRILSIQVSLRKEPFEGTVQPELWADLRGSGGAALRP